jgi:hypothetical protein
MAVNRMPVDSDAGLTELIRRLGDDSKRLVTDEVRLAKLEVHENLQRGGKDLMWLTAAFGAGVVALIAATLVVVTLIGRIANGHMWIGALITGVIELALGVTLLKRGADAFKDPSYSLTETRTSLEETRTWVKSDR